MKLEKKPKTLLHLRLTTEDWVECFRELTRAELGVLYYIRTKDPYGDRNLEIDCTELGKELGIHRTSISRALEELKKKGFIDMEIEKARVRQKINNRKLTLLNNHEKESNNEKIEDLQMCAPTHSSCADAQPRASTHSNEPECTHECADAQLRAPMQKKEPEPIPDKIPTAPQTIKTYSDFIQTLSEEERASFLDFCLEKTKNLSKEVNDIEAWLAHTTKAGQNRWEVYYEKFTSHQQKQNSKSKSNPNSQLMKKFTEEMEQQYQQARENWQKSQAEAHETGGTT